MFGAINALFTGLAFAGVIVVILMQREQLNLQRKELARSTKAREAQERALVIAAQLNANAALLEHRNLMTQADSESEADINERSYTSIRQLLAELASIKEAGNDRGRGPGE